MKTTFDLPPDLVREIMLRAVLPLFSSLAAPSPRISSRELVELGERALTTDDLARAGISL